MSSATTPSDSDVRQLRDLPRSERIKRVFGVEPTPYQAELLDFADEKPRAQTAPKKGRQVGATFTAGMIGADHALTHRDTDVLYAAPSQGTANEMFRECKKLFWNADPSLEQFGVVPGGDNKETWEFVNGTRILSRTLGNVEQENNSGNRGMNPTCVIIDEAAYEKDAVYTEEIEAFFITHEEFEYHLISTPAGRSGYFYEKVEQEGKREVDDALAEKWSWYSPYWPTQISPFAQEDFIEQKRKELDSQTFAQEFLGEFVEASDAYLPHGIVKPCIESNPDRASNPARYLGVDPARKGDDREVIYDIDEHGNYWNIWSTETTSGPEFVGRLTAFQTGTDPGEPDIGTGTLPKNGYESIVVEENGVGGYGADFAEAGLGRVICPVTSSNKSKQEMYQRLKNDLESQAITIPSHRMLIDQTTNLQYSYTQTGLLRIGHPKGKHDDFPDGLALANAGRTGVAEDFRTDLNGAITSTRSIPSTW